MNEKTPEALESELEDLLHRIFDAGAAEYEKRGFRRRVGYGARPAIIHIDMANAWTQPSPFSCRNMETIIPACQELTALARTKHVPIIYTTTAFDIVDTSLPSDMGLWHRKIPAEVLDPRSPLVEIDERLAPAPGELVLTKKRASAFPGTNLGQFLTANLIDTLIVTGVTAAGCVRHTVEDAITEGFRPIVVREAVGDRVPGVVSWNLFDLEAKFGDVESLADVLAYLDGLPDFSETRPTPIS